MFEPSNEIERLLVAATKNQADRAVFEKAVLVAGVGRDQDRVTIAYTGAQR